MQKWKLSFVCASLMLGACSSNHSAIYLADADLKFATQCNSKTFDRDAAISGSFDGNKNIYVSANGFACVFDGKDNLIQTLEFGLEGEVILATHQYVTQSCYGFFNCQRLEELGTQEPPVKAGTMTATS